jgi:type IV pilus biogenesis protein CpaD/CtpE
MTRILALCTLSLLAACASDEPRAPGAPLVCGSPGLLGCANDANLRMMVADPRDLERGVDRSAVADEAAIGAVREHRAARPSAGSNTEKAN